MEKTNPSTIIQPKVSFSGELMKNQFPATLVDAHESMKVVKDINGASMLFAIGSDKVLYAYLQNNIRKTGWQKFDLSSSLKPNYVAVAFEVAQGHDGKLQLAIAVAPQGKPRETELYFTALIANSTQDADWANFKSQWVARPFQSNTEITEIMIGANNGEGEPLAAVVTQEGTEAKQYLVNTNVKSVYNGDIVPGLTLYAVPPDVTFNCATG